MGAAPSVLLAACGRQLVAHTLAGDGSIVATTACPAQEAIQFAAASSDGRRLYLACSDGGIGRPGKRHVLQWLDVDADGGMRPAGSLPLPQRPVHVAVDAATARVHLAFNRPSAYACVPLDAAGIPAGIQHHVLDEAVVGWFAHQVLPLPGAGKVLLSCRGDDPDPPAPEHPGSLRLLSAGDDGVRLEQLVAPGQGLGFGPRNSAPSPDGRQLLVVLERQNRLEVFPWEDGRLAQSPRFQASTLPEDAHGSAKQFAGDLCLHPTGRFAYVLNRSRDAMGSNGVAVFAIDPAGAPRFLQAMPLPGRHPRTARLSADGAWMAVAVMEPDDTAGARPGVCLLAVGPDGHLTPRWHWPCPAGEAPMMWADFHRPAS